MGEASFATVAGTQHHSTFVDKFALCGFAGKVFAVGQKVPFRQGVSHSFLRTWMLVCFVLCFVPKLCAAIVKGER